MWMLGNKTLHKPLRGAACTSLPRGREGPGDKRQEARLTPTVVPSLWHQLAQNQHFTLGEMISKLTEPPRQMG